jgi:hypothetical protein
MKNFITGIPPMVIALVMAFITQVASLGAQTLTFPLNNGFSVDIYGAGPTICQPSSAFSFPGFFFLGISPFAINSYSNQWNNNEGSYHLAEAGVTRQIIVEIPVAGGLGTNTTLLYNYGEFDVNIFTTPSSSTGVYNPNNNTNRHVLDLNFPVGMSKGYLVFIVDDPGWPSHMCVIPFVVEGATVAQVESLGTTVQPQMPYMVLHAPPGDGSSSTFQQSKTTCRELVDSYAEEGSNSANLAVKLGVAGSAGIFVTTNFEFSVTFSGGVTAGEMVVKTQGKQTCVTVNEEFSTTELSGPTGGGDVFIGYGTDLAYGVYPFIIADQATCASKLDTGLVFAPVGPPRKFAYTKTAILSDIAELEAVVADSLNVGAKTANDAQNQLDVWNQVLAMNDANVNNPDNELIGTLNFSAGVNSSQESSITITENNSIQYEHFLEGTFGVEAVVEVGGSGVTGGYEFKSARRYGATQNQTEESSKLVKYTLADDDPGDVFNVDVVRDPMFGTPAFRIKQGTKSSCPYQGGYQRDQPSLKHDNTADEHITSLGNPVGGSFNFLIDLCNESNETRTYNLKLNAASNSNGAVVSAAGVPLNGNDLGQSYTIPAGACQENVVVTVGMLNASSPQAYPDLELFLYAPCEEDIQSSIFASVFFGGATSTGEVLSNIAQVAVFPNPAAQTATLVFELLESAPIRVELYDMLGRLYSAGLNEQLPVGTHQRTVDVSQLPNGLYWLRIQSGPSDFLTRKLVVSH